MKQKIFSKKKFWKIDITIGTLLVLSLSIIGNYVVARMTQPKPEPLLPQTREEMNIDRTPITQWLPCKQQYNDIVNQDGILSLDIKSYSRQKSEYRKGIAVHDPQGYIQPPTSISENVFVCTKILAHTNPIDYSFRLNNKFQVIHGDGDDRSIALKIIDWKNPNGEYIRPTTNDPNDPHIDHLNRFRLDVPLPIGKEFTSCLTIVAPLNSISKKIRAELRVFDQDGKLMDLGPMPVWDLDDPNQQNGSTQFSAGLIDARGVHPIVELRGYCAVEMKDYGDRPSDRERDACINP